MYTIGEFSAITAISKKTLRYYDEINLLNPSNINEYNNYRQYSEEKIQIAEKIIAFKDFGLSLTDIKCLIFDYDNSNIDEILKLRLSAVEKEIDVLRQQEKEIRVYLGNKKPFISYDVDLRINEREFTGGDILFLDFNEEHKDLHSMVNEFYDYSANNNCKLISGHYFKKSMNSKDEDNVRVFAFVENQQQNCNIIKIKTQKVLEVSCLHPKSKNQAYKQLINYGKKKSIEISEFIEDYNVNEGKLMVTIYGLIDANIS